MKFSYPTEKIKSLKDFYSQRSGHGHFPVGKDGVWHGGVHIRCMDNDAIPCYCGW